MPLLSPRPRHGSILIYLGAIASIGSTVAAEMCAHSRRECPADTSPKSEDAQCFQTCSSYDFEGAQSTCCGPKRDTCEAVSFSCPAGTTLRVGLDALCTTDGACDSQLGFARICCQGQLCSDSSLSCDSNAGLVAGPAGARCAGAECESQDFMLGSGACCREVKMLCSEATTDLTSGCGSSGMTLALGPEAVCSSSFCNYEDFQSTGSCCLGQRCTEADSYLSCSDSGNPPAEPRSGGPWHCGGSMCSNEDFADAYSQCCQKRIPDCSHTDGTTPTEEKCKCQRDSGLESKPGDDAVLFCDVAAPYCFITSDFEGNEHKLCQPLPRCSRTSRSEANSNACICFSDDGTEQTTCDAGTGLYCSQHGDSKANGVDEYGNYQYKQIPICHGPPCESVGADVQIPCECAKEFDFEKNIDVIIACTEQTGLICENNGCRHADCHSKDGSEATTTPCRCGVDKTCGLQDHTSSSSTPPYCRVKDTGAECTEADCTSQDGSEPNEAGKPCFCDGVTCGPGAFCTASATTRESKCSYDTCANTNGTVANDLPCSCPLGDAYKVDCEAGQFCTKSARDAFDACSSFPTCKAINKGANFRHCVVCNATNPRLCAICDAETILLDGECVGPVSVVATSTRGDGENSGDNGGLQVEVNPGLPSQYSTHVPSAFFAITRKGRIRAWGDWEAGGIIPCDPRAYFKQGSSEPVHVQPCSFGRTLFDWQTKWTSTSGWSPWEESDWNLEYARLDERRILLTPRDITQPKKTDNHRVWIDDDESPDDPDKKRHRGMWADQTIYEMPGSWCTAGTENDFYNTFHECGYKFQPCTSESSQFCSTATLGGGPFRHFGGFPSRTEIFQESVKQTSSKVISAVATNLAVAVIIQKISTSSVITDVSPQTEVYAWGHFTSDKNPGDLNNGEAPIYSASPALISSEVSKDLQDGNPREVFSTCCAFSVLMEAGNIVNWGDEARADRALSPSAQSLQNSGGAKAIYTTDGAFATVTHSGEVFVWGDKTKGGEFPYSLLQNGQVPAWGKTEDRPALEILSIASSSGAFAATTKVYACPSISSTRFNDNTIDNGDIVHKFGQTPSFSLFSGSDCLSIFVWGGVDSVKSSTTGGELYSGSVTNLPNETQFRHNPSNQVGTGGSRGHEIRLWKPLRSLKANRYAFAVVLESGTVVSWGREGKGALGPQARTQIQARIDAGRGPRALFSTDDSFAALLVDGTVAVWGAIDDSTSPLPSGHKVATIFSTADTFAYLGLGRDDVFLHGKWNEHEDLGTIPEGHQVHITKEISKFLRDESSVGSENLENKRGKIVNVHAGSTALAVEFEDGSLFSFGIFREPRRVVYKPDEVGGGEYRPNVEIRRRVYSINTKSSQVPSVYRKDGWHHVNDNFQAIGLQNDDISERRIQSIVPGLGRFAVVMTDGSVYEFPPSSTLKSHQDFDHYAGSDGATVVTRKAKEEYQEHIMSEPVWFLADTTIDQYVCDRNCRKSCQACLNDCEEKGCSNDYDSYCGNCLFEQIPLATTSTYQSCPRGYVSKDGTCEACPVGTKQILRTRVDFTAVSSCLHCTEGRSLGGKSAALTCEACLAGQFSSTVGCETCSAGQYREDLKEPNCTRCPALHYLGFDNTAHWDTHDSRDDCIRCPTGQLTGRGSGQQKETGASYCSVCNAGTKTVNITSDDIRCSPCTRGKFQDYPKSILCKACPAGYKSASLSGSAYCEKCLPGLFASAEKQSLCLSCAENTFAKEAASVICEHCPRGRTASPGSSKCVGCSAGKHVTPNVSQACIAISAECKREAVANDKFSCTDCKPGKYSAETNLGIHGEYDCLECQKGFKQPERGMTFCLPCLPGEYSNTTGATNCSNCAIGFYSSKQSASSCTACPAGKYTDERGQASCLPCLPGQFGATRGAHNCSTCAANTFSVSSGATSCEGCGAGKKSEPGSAKCQKCDAGEAGTGPGGVCEACDLGQYRNSSDDLTTRCRACPKGTYNNVRGQASCLPCLPGQFGNRLGLNSCNFCPSGFFANVSQMQACLSCPIGYSSVQSSAKCDGCAAGKYGKGCLRCNTGKYREGGDPQADRCRDCLAGFYQPKEGQGSCLPCIPGKYQSLKGEAGCTPCDARTFNNATERKTECESCPGGKNSKAGSSICSDCAAGTFIVAGGACQQCPAGWHSPEPEMQQCEQCGTGEKGETSEVGSSSCVMCDLGKFQIEVGICVDCPKGFYQDGKGSKFCKACPENTFNPLPARTAIGDCAKCNVDYAPFTTTAGETGVSDARTGCVCAGANPSATEGTDASRGYYRSLSGNFTHPETKAENILCKPCPEGASCHANGMDVLSISAKVAFWRPHAYSTIFADCRIGVSGTAEYVQIEAARRCCPLGAAASSSTLMPEPPASGSSALTTARSINQTTTKISICRWKRGRNKTSTKNNPDDQCLEGFSGAVCNVCAEGYVKVGDDCTPCLNKPNLGAAIAALLVCCVPALLGLAIFLAVCSAKRDASEATDSAETVSGLFGQAKILLSYLQIMGSMPGVLDGVPWPKSFVSFTIPMGIINLDLMALFQVSQCELAVNFQDQFVAHMCVPPLLICTIISAHYFANCVRKAKSTKEKNQRSSSSYKVMILAILLVYPGLATRVFNMFRCIKVDGVDNGLVLASDFAVRCYRDEHVYYAAAAFVFMVIYVVGIPLAMFLLLYRNRKHLHDDTNLEKHTAVKAYLGGLYQQCK